MFSKLMKKTIAVAAIAAMTSVMAAVATPWWTIDFDSYTEGAKVSAANETIETQGYWTQQEDDLSVVTSQSLSLNTQGEDLLWTPNAPAENYDSVILDAEVKFVASDVEPTTDNSMQTAIYLKATDGGDVLCVYQATEDGKAWEAKDVFTIADGDTKHVTITIDYSDETPMVTLTIDETSVVYPVANVAEKVSSVAFRGTGAVDNFTAQTSVNATYVADVDGQGFETYAAALAYVAANGGNLKITGDSDETLSFSELTFNSDATIDLNGKTIEASFVVDNGAQFSIDNGTVNAPMGYDVVYIKNGKATVGANATLNASDNCAVFMKNKDNADAQLALDVYGTLVGAEGFGTIQGNGNNLPASEINIYDGATVTNENDLAIYHPQNGTLTIGAATIAGTTGIEMRAGELVVNEGAIIEGTAEFSATPNGNGSTVLGAAIALSQHTTEQPTSVTVNGGTLKGARAFYQDNLASGTSTSVSATIAAGTTLDGVIEVAEEGFEMPQAADGSYTLEAVTYVANVGTEKFKTYAEAFAYVVANGGDLVITGASDETLGVYNITQDATIDLGGQSITAAFVVDGGAQFEIDNGTVTAPADNDVIYIKDGKATVKADATLNASTDCAVFMKNLDNANAQLALDVYGTLVGAAGFGTIQGNGSNKPASVINIYDGATVTNAADLAIYHPQNGTLTIGAATITGTTGIEMRAGNLVVNGATITATGTYSAEANGNGSTTVGAAIALSQHNTSLPTSVTVNSGTLTGDVAFYAAGDAEDISATIAAGTVNGKIEVAEGFEMPEIDGSYTLEAVTYVANVGTEKFKTYAEAFAYVAANGGDLVITGASDETLGVYNITKNATIDLGGQSITAAFVVDGGAQFEIDNGTVTALAKNDVIYIKNGKATVGADATLVASTDCAVFMKNLDNANAQLALDVYGTLVGAAGFGTIQGNGSNKPASVINIYDGATVTNAADLAIYHPQNGTLTIGAATITGTTGIEMRAGELVVDGATITATGTYSAEANGNGSTTVGAAIALSQHNTSLPTSVEVKSGTLTGDVAFYAAGDAEDISATIGKDVVLANGADIVVAEGFEMPKAADGSYTLGVVKKEFVPAKIQSIELVDDTAKLEIGSASQVKVYFKETLDAEWTEVVEAEFAEGVVTAPATTATGFYKVEVIE